MRLYTVLGWVTAVFLFLFFIITDMAAGQETPTPVMPVPTADRLSAPPTVPAPTQADNGAQLFWLHCQPCHGDIGQGLTDEWRAEYPEDHQNCWKSGCHGDRPYEEGFTLPETVPAIIGEGTLSRFDTLGQVYHFTRATMPFEYPGVLTDEEYLAVTAFLARENNLEDREPLTEENVLQIRLRPVEPAANPAIAAAPQPVTTRQENGNGGWSKLIWGSGFMLIIVGGGLWLWRQQKQSIHQ